MNAQFIFWGKVKKGKNRGNTFGFPTANITLHKKIPEGIYASTVSLENITYPAATFIGSAKTFGEKDYKAEAYLLDFRGNLYGKRIHVKLYKKIRENKQFSSEKELIEQMREDVLATREFFG